MRRVLLLLAAFVLAVSAAVFGGGVAHADTSTPWIHNHWLKAYSGGGCAYWDAENPGAILRSGVCGRSAENLDYRIITRTNGQQVIQVAIVELSIDLTVSGGHWVWEPANSSTHVFPLDQFSGGINLMFQGDHFMGPNGNTLPLKDITPISDEAHAGWAFWNCQDAC